MINDPFVHFLSIIVLTRDRRGSDKVLYILVAMCSQKKRLMEEVDSFVCRWNWPAN